VGLTRAREKAYVSFAGNRRIYGNWTNSIPSRFVDELPAEHIESVAEQGLYYPGRSQHWDSSGFQIKATIAPEDRFRNLPRHGQSFSNKPRISKTTFSRSDRVRHESFGEGEVVNVDGQKLDIDFGSHGLKRIMDGFVEKL
jgi:DNA helicase-2/ATP-dependent DNA helicase PcrA